MKLKIVTYPNKILRQKGKDLLFPLSAMMKKLAKDMLDTVKDANGVGLAAPQVNHSVNMIAVNLEHMGMPPFILVNPVITKFSKKMHEMEEGCLSIPGVYGMVTRPERVSVKGYTLAGKQVAFDCDGMLAKVVQHEIDHINGVLIIDKINAYTQGEKELKEMERM